MIRVERLAGGGDGAWDEFLLSQPDSLLYATTRYRDLLLRHLGCTEHYLVALDDEDELRGVLPLMWAADEDGRRVWNSLPFYGSNGGVTAASGEARDVLLDAYAQIATAPETLASTVAPNPFAHDDPGPAPVHTLTDVRISQQTPLGGDVMELIDSSARRNVRKALSNGVTVERDPAEMGALARIHRENIESVGGLAKEASFFDDVQAVFTAGEDYDLWVARHEEAVVAALLVFHWNRTSEYFTPAVAHDARPLQPLAPVLAEAMADATARGMTRWNWGATWESQTGVYRFKRKWGAEEGRYSLCTQLNDPEVLAWPRERFGERFPHFFVVPFSALESEGAHI